MRLKPGPPVTVFGKTPRGRFDGASLSENVAGVSDAIRLAETRSTPAVDRQVVIEARARLRLRFDSLRDDMFNVGHQLPNRNYPLDRFLIANASNRPPRECRKLLHGIGGVGVKGEYALVTTALTLSATFASNGDSFEVSYTAGAGNDLTLTVVL